MRKILFVLLILFFVGACCTRRDNCKCPRLQLGFMFICFTNKELDDFRIIRYDSATGAKVSEEKIEFMRPSGSGAQFAINLESDTRYDIQIVNTPLGISRLFSDFRYSIEDAPQQCNDCIKVRYKTCSTIRSIVYLVDRKPIDKSKTAFKDSPTTFSSNRTDCF